jgi:hypothetical protein
MNAPCVQPGGTGGPDRLALEEQLHRKLYQARVTRACNPAEVYAVRNIAVYLAELRVIKDVEELRAEFEPHLLMNRGFLM